MGVEGRFVGLKCYFKNKEEITILAFTLLKLSIVIQSYVIYSSPVVL